MKNHDEFRMSNLFQLTLQLPSLLQPPLRDLLLPPLPLAAPPAAPADIAVATAPHGTTSVVAPAPVPPVDAHCKIENDKLRI